jgi:hypothetical protein
MALPRRTDAAPPDDDLALVERTVQVLQAHLPMQRSTVRVSGSNPSKRSCDVQRSGLVVAGTGRTNNQGIWSVSYSGDLLCGVGGEVQPLRPIVVATARGATPAVMTVGVSEIDSTEFKIIVRSFKMDGTPAGRTPFAWHAISLTQFVPG